MKKRLMATAMLVAMVTSLVSNSLAANAYAKGVYEKTNENELKEELEKRLDISHTNTFNDDKYEFISRKVAEEKENYTGILPEEFEDKLNENGVLDEEIERLTADELKFICSTGVDDLEIISSIYMFEDAENSDMNGVELSAEQIDRLYAEQYYNQDDCIEPENEEATLSVENVSRDITKSSMMATDMTSEGVAVSNVININNATNVEEYMFCEEGEQQEADTETACNNADCQEKDKYGNKKCVCKNHSYLKQTAYAKKNGRTINLTIIAEWIGSPEYKYVDALRVNFTNMTYNNGSCSVKHRYTRTIRKYVYKTSVAYQQYGGILCNSSVTTGTYMNTMAQRDKLYSAVDKGKSITVTVDRYDVEPEGIVVFMKFHQDTSNIAWSSGGMTYTQTNYYYSNEGIIINVTLLDNIDPELTEEFYSTYYHFYTKKEYDIQVIKEIILDFATSAITVNKIGMILSTGELLIVGPEEEECCTSTVAFNPTLQDIYQYGYRYK